VIISSSIYTTLSHLYLIHHVVHLEGIHVVRRVNCIVTGRKADRVFPCFDYTANSNILQLFTSNQSRFISIIYDWNEQLEQVHSDRFEGFEAGFGRDGSSCCREAGTDWCVSWIFIFGYLERKGRKMLPRMDHTSEEQREHGEATERMEK
jgi:hypothetical protein